MTKIEQLYKEWQTLQPLNEKLERDIKSGQKKWSEKVVRNFRIDNRKPKNYKNSTLRKIRNKPFCYSAAHSET